MVRAGDTPAARGQLAPWTRAFLDTVATLLRTCAAAEATEAELLHTLGVFECEFVFGMGLEVPK